MSESLLLEKLSLLRERCILEVAELNTSPCFLQEFNPISLSNKKITKTLIRSIEPFSIATAEKGLWFGRDVNIVFEGAQGMLLDQHVGFHPHTTWSDLTPYHATEICEGLDIDYQVLGLTRAYTTRHGKGPFPTYSQALTYRYPDACNTDNRWQGGFRVGWLDLHLLKYAVSGLGCKLDGLAVSHLDQIDENYKVCTDYGHYCDPYTYKYPMRRTSISLHATPSLSASDESDLLSRLWEIAPVVIQGYGPKAEDRVGQLPARVG
jgi:adenylosuccinate synthase